MEKSSQKYLYIQIWLVQDPCKTIPKTVRKLRKHCSHSHRCTPPYTPFINSVVVPLCLRSLGCLLLALISKCMFCALLEATALCSHKHLHDNELSIVYPLVRPFSGDICHRFLC